VVDLKALFDEVVSWDGPGLTDGRLLVSDPPTHSPYHPDLDRLSAASLGPRMSAPLGGYRPGAYEDKAGRRGLRVCASGHDAALEETHPDGVVRRNRLAQTTALRWEGVFSQRRKWALACGRGSATCRWR